MARVRSKDTTPEWVVRRLVFALGYRYRLHVRALPGCPDLVFRRRRKIIFVNGCFWHGHECRAGRIPATRRAFWLAKLTRNRERDRQALQQLWHDGWSALVVWECETADMARLRDTLALFLGSGARTARTVREYPWDPGEAWGQVAETDA